MEPDFPARPLTVDEVCRFAELIQLQEDDLWKQKARATDQDMSVILRVEAKATGRVLGLFADFLSGRVK